MAFESVANPVGQYSELAVLALRWAMVFRITGCGKTTFVRETGGKGETSETSERGGTGGTTATGETGEGSRFSERRIRNFEIRIAPFSHV